MTPLLQAAPGVVHCKALKSKSKPGAYTQQLLHAAAGLLHCRAWHWHIFVSSQGSVWQPLCRATSALHISMPYSPSFAAAFEGCALQALACLCSSQLLSSFLEVVLLSTCLLPFCECMVCLHRIVGSWCERHTCRAPAGLTSMSPRLAPLPD